MGLQYSSGNDTVDRVGQIDFSLCGSVNLLPDTWYKTITYDNGKPNFIASIILSEIVYWYKPQVMKNEFTGEIVAVKPKFKADLLQRSRRSFENKFGLSEKQVKDALYFLEHKVGVIRRERRNIISDTDISLGNVLFIDLDVDRLIELTFPKLAENSENSDTSGEKTTLGTYKSQGVDANDKSQGRDIEVPRVGHRSTEVGISKSQGENIKVPTYTKTTTKTTTKISSSSVKDNTDQMCDRNTQGEKERKTNENDIYPEIIAENICLDSLMQEAQNDPDRERIKMLYDIICKTVCSTAKTIRINSESIPCEVVKSVFLKIGYKEITYVCEKLDEPKDSPIHNLESYIRTLLYNAKTTASEYWTQKGLYDQYGGGVEETRKKKRTKKSSFNDFDQREYSEEDYDKLVKALCSKV